MGGSVASKLCEKVLQTDLSNQVVGLIVIDVVEGTAIEALPFMNQIVNNRPTQFPNLEEVIKWSIKSGTLKNLESARVSMPTKVRERVSDSGEMFYEWKVDLINSEQYWMNWFKGLTNSFLSLKIPKILMLAEKERMDKELTIAQMQGKFKVCVLHNVGHYMHEDDYKNCGRQFHQFLTTFRLPQNVQEQHVLKVGGVGTFTP